MIRLGLTGSIGMGKSTVAAMFSARGVPVFDADAVVHRLQGPGGRLVGAIEAVFPDTTGPQGVDRTALAEAVLGDPVALKRLESLVHPAVAEERAAFLDANAQAPLVLLDIPLLFETGGEAQVDKIVVVSAPADVQRARVLARPGMTPERFAAILARQTPDAEKRARADFVIDTGGPLAGTEAQVDAVIALASRAEQVDTPPMREIVFDTETTGLSFSGGDRLVEIGCVELVNRVETGRTFHAYFNPERAMAAEAQAVHGLSDAFLSDKPLFAHLVEDMLEFLGDAPLIAHNAGFDFSFLNGELGQCGRVLVAMERMVDTLQIARQRHPGAKHTLDALCTRYGIDRSHRVLHGALLDAQLLAQVYVELTGGRQIGLTLVSDEPEPIAAAAAAASVVRPPRPFAANDAELAAHAAFLKEIANPLWLAEA